MRKRNPRRVLVEMLSTPRKRINWIHGRFSSVTTHLYDRDVRTEDGNYLRRKRRTGEYPENDPGVWGDVCAQAECAIEELAEIAEYAKQQYSEARIRRDADKPQ